MQQNSRKPAVTRGQFDAVLLDLDGVITDTASVHATCWKQMFDEYLRAHARQRSEEFHPFEITNDYSLYVDGKTRFDGVRDFLTSRNIQLSEGTHDDSPQAETVGGLANRKNELVNKIIAKEGVTAYEGTRKFIQKLRDEGFEIAVVTSSQNCETVLEAAKLETFFDAKVDGNVITEQKLTGKPAPDSYLFAAKVLDVNPARAVVVEDALAGVQAGCSGKFGLVIGVARKGNAAELQKSGAHIVVSDLSELL